MHYAAGNGYGDILEAIAKVGGDTEFLDGLGKRTTEWTKKNTRYGGSGDSENEANGASRPGSARRRGSGRGG